MNPQEYDRMRQLEDWYWWFVARREAALRFAEDFRPRRAPLRVPHDVALQHFRRYTTSEMGRLMRRTGFRVSKLTYLLALLFPLFVAQRLLTKLRPNAENPQAQLVPVSQAVNRFLIRLQGVELAIARRLSLPFGATVFCVAQKPFSAQAAPSARPAKNGCSAKRGRGAPGASLSPKLHG